MIIFQKVTHSNFLFSLLLFLFLLGLQFFLPSLCLFYLKLGAQVLRRPHRVLLLLSLLGGCFYLTNSKGLEILPTPDK